MTKNSFILQTRLKTVVAKLSDKQAGVLLKSIFDYADNGTLATFEDGMVAVVFEMVRQDIDYAAKKYAETCAKRAESGRLGGKQKKQMLANASKCQAKKANASKSKHNEDEDDVEDDIKSISNDMLILPQNQTSQDDPNAGTFRAGGRTKAQKLACWWVKNYYPKLYETAGKKSTASWYARYGKSLNEILNLADGSLPLAVASILATQEQMRAFQKRKGEDVVWGLEAVSRNFTENFVRAQEIMQSGVLPQEVQNA